MADPRTDKTALNRVVIESDPRNELNDEGETNRTRAAKYDESIANDGGDGEIVKEAREMKRTLPEERAFSKC
jgi:hypothetical protein